MGSIVYDYFHRLPETWNQNPSTADLHDWKATVGLEWASLGEDLALVTTAFQGMLISIHRNPIGNLFFP